MLLLGTTLERDSAFWPSARSFARLAGHQHAAQMAAMSADRRRATEDCARNTMPAPTHQPDDGPITNPAPPAAPINGPESRGGMETSSGGGVRHYSPYCYSLHVGSRGVGAADPRLCFISGIRCGAAPGFWTGILSADELLRLRQGRWSVMAFAVDFRIVARCSGWPPEPLANVFLQRLVTLIWDLLIA